MEPPSQLLIYNEVKTPEQERFTITLLKSKLPFCLPLFFLSWLTITELPAKAALKQNKSYIANAEALIPS